MSVVNFFICFACAGVIVFCWRMLDHLARARRFNNTGELPIDRPRTLIIHRLEHICNDISSASTAFQFMRIPFELGRQTWYLLCRENTITMYKTIDEAKANSDKNVYSMLELTLIGRPDYSVVIRQLTREYNNVETRLHWGFDIG